MRIHSSPIRWLLISLTAAILLPGSRAGGQTPAAGPENQMQHIRTMLGMGDTAVAIVLLDSIIEAESHNGSARLTRGWLYLAGGEQAKAEIDFKYALRSDNPRTKSMAWLALGDMVASVPFRKWDAVAREYLMAIKADPTNLEAYYRRAEVSLQLGSVDGDYDPKGYRIASDMFMHLLCIDPAYRDVFITWRDTILDKYSEEKRRAAECLESHIVDHPEHSAWLFDAAQYRYDNDEIELAISDLDRLERADSAFEPVERWLLRARCLVEQNDSSGFEDAYSNALQAAAITGKFSRLAAHAQAIFTPAEEKKAREIKTAGEWLDFFSTFWGRRDPDPLTPGNERLFEHYRRLREAQRKYSLMDPYSRALTDTDFMRMESFMSGTMGMFYDYDPELFFKRCPELVLQQRGLLYVRHGPPDMINRPILPYGFSPIEEIWYYGRTMFPFKEGHSSIGDFVYVPLPVDDIGNMNKAMETESYKDPVSTLRQDLYAVEFMADDGTEVYEVYQALPVDKLGEDEIPEASAALMDSSWRELSRDSCAGFAAWLGDDEYWLGVNSLPAQPASDVIAARMSNTGRTAVYRHNIGLTGFAKDRLELSGIVLGSPLEPGAAAHTRNGIDLLPRPSMEYESGELMTVYLELYGLSAGRNDKSGYTERVSVIREGDERGFFGKLVGIFGGGERRSSLTLTFDREVAAPRRTISEYFTIDTSLLLPGEYRMKIEVIDLAAGESRQVGCFFRLK